MTRMIERRPWLAQGDVFADVPIVLTGVDDRGDVSVTQQRGPALLLTYDCQLDKATRQGVPKVSRLHFAPLIAVATQDASRQSLLRQKSVTPYEAFYLGDCGRPTGEAFILLSEIYSLPAALFAFELRDASAIDPAANTADRYLVLTADDNRIGSLDDDERTLLQDKHNLFWTQRQRVVSEMTATR